jgi:glycosyltransferase involved in cell wall biosynthesis
MSRVGRGEWEITAVAPSSFRGDLRRIRLEQFPDEACACVGVNAYFTRSPHVFLYGAKLRSILSEDWDLVHSWEEPFVAAGAQIALWTPPNVPYVFWTGQTIVKRYPFPFSQIDRYCFARCQGWATRGELGIEAMLTRGHGKKPHRAIPLGVDVKRFVPDRRAGQEICTRLDWDANDAPVVGYLGRFVEEKGLTTLTAALDLVKTPWRALFLGDGPMKSYLEKWARGYGDKVRIASKVSHDEVPAYLNAMDVLCAPSRTTRHWREIFGRMVVEAFACGTPVIASASGELPNVVEQAGILVGEHDTAAWVSSIELLISNPALRAELAGRGLTRVHQRYTWAVVARQHLDFFGEILDSKSTNRMSA